MPKAIHRRAPKAKAQSPKGPAWKAIACAEQLVVSGGLLKRPQVVDTMAIADDQFVKLNKRDSWLCQMVTGKCQSSAPLARTRMIELLSEAIEQHLPAAAARPQQPSHSRGVEGLGLDDDEEEPPVVVERVSKRGRRQRGPSIIQVEKPTAFGPDRSSSRRSAGPSHSRGTVTVLSCAPTGRTGKKSLWIHRSDLEWALCYLAEEAAEGGVDYEPEECSLARPYYSVKKRSWVCRARAPDKTMFRKCITVPHTRQAPHSNQQVPLSRAEFADERRAKLEEILAWKKDVEDGMLV